MLVEYLKLKINYLMLRLIFKQTIIENNNKFK